MPFPLTWGGKGVRENFPKSFPPVKVSGLLGFLLLCLTSGAGQGGGDTFYLHRCTEPEVATVQQNTNSKGKGKEFVTVLLPLPAQRSFIQRKCTITELEVFASMG